LGREVAVAKAKVQVGGIVLGAVVLVICCGSTVASFTGDEPDGPPDSVSETTFRPAPSLLPTPSTSAQATPTTVVVAPTTPTPAEETTPDVYYANCAEAEAAGDAPLLMGEPRYRAQLDRDGDGIACESSSGDGDSGGDDPGSDNAYYANCSAARAAGAAPLHRGDPGYRPGLDRDGDGTACE
jgi:hypothetical protein